MPMEQVPPNAGRLGPWPCPCASPWACTSPFNWLACAARLVSRLRFGTRAAGRCKAYLVQSTLRMCLPFSFLTKHYQ